jgi:hypothetical protein
MTSTIGAATTTTTSIANDSNIFNRMHRWFSSLSERVPLSRTARKVILLTTVPLALYVGVRTYCRYLVWNRPRLLHYQRMPSSMTLFARGVLLPRSTIQSATLPKTDLFLHDQPPDDIHVVNFSRLFGFPSTSSSAVLPFVYLQARVGGLQMDAMTGANVPISMIGSVNSTTVIKQHRKIASDEMLSFHCSLSDLFRRHHNGVSFDIITQAFTADRDTVVWESVFTVFVRLPIAPASPLNVIAQTELPMVRINTTDGWAFDELFSMVVPEDAGSRYAQLNGDYNPIHVSKLGAKMFGFKTMIAHG